MPAPSAADSPRRTAAPAARRYPAVAATVLLALPTIALSVAIVLILGAWAGLWLSVTAVVIWVFAGVMLFDAAWFTPDRARFAKASGYRRPIPPEDEILAVAWGNVTSAPGVDGWPYSLWVEQSEDPNAAAAPSRIVAVTSSALTLDPRQLEAMLAHELGHHRNVDPRVRLLDAWIAMPRRVLWAVCRLAGRPAGILGALAPCVRSIVAIGMLPVAAIALTPVVGRTAALLFVALLIVEPLTRGVQERRDEFAADRAAVDLGYGRELAAALRQWEPADLPRLVALRRRLYGTHPALAPRVARITARLGE
ncbi:STE24 endopeptidase [Nocardia tenerifensis]|uniref:STE24 endopeptidase n=1 Tax=Nocardia tenerifensis TaxID=228006 RepID=A0A318K353_9NOCA|nr:M48 family metalloprotease [Nocardia tenerifensis]PXX66474.1 STE24 endopeptidase [Nocardia tenerifensis]